jgi:hypothetical protein
MSSVHDNEPIKPIDQKQVATNELSAAARLDRATEDRLYRMYRAYFQRAEEERRWVIWSDVPWDQTSTKPSPELVEMVWRAYQDDAFLPDYSARAMQVLRASRGRAWFLTRWAYEEGKHLLGINEWLVRCGAFTNLELRDASETLMHHFRWEPEYIDGVALFVEFLAWELKEVERGQAIKARAEAEGEVALTALMERVLIDEEDHRAFFIDSLKLIAETYPDQVADAARKVADSQHDPAIAEALYRAMGLPPLPR